jgi:hypothetical protein
MIRDFSWVASSFSVARFSMIVSFWDHFDLIEGYENGAFEYPSAVGPRCIQWTDRELLLILASRILHIFYDPLKLHQGDLCKYVTG